MKINLIYLLIPLVLLLNACGESQVNTNGAGNNGVAGSMARFSVVDDILYAISGQNLQLIDVESPAEPHLWSRLNVGFGIETLFPYQDYLFIGSQTGVFIYDNSTPEFPQLVGQFSHAFSCDPVVVQDDYAYVTLRSNSVCRGGTNQLDILNISDVTNPYLVASYAMQEPYGLGISGNYLYVCDGPAGLKILDVSVKTELQIVDNLFDVNCYDVIPHNNILLVSAKDRIIQFDMDGARLTKLSELGARESQMSIE